jgi:carbohydrate-selective porin OprB
MDAWDAPRAAGERSRPAPLAARVLPGLTRPGPERTNSPIEEVKLFSEYFGCGLTLTGLGHRRDRDSLALGLACGRLSDDRIPQPPGASHPSNETMLQLTYQATVTRNLFVQPTLTYIIDPGTNSAIRNALPITLRGGLLF